MPLSRKAPMKRGTGIKPRNAKRQASEWKRTYGSKARVAFVNRLPCWACGYCGPTPRQNCHTESGGMGRKSDYTTIIALCPPCHMKSHDKGWLAISMTEESRTRAAAQTEAAWLARGGGDGDD